MQYFTILTLWACRFATLFANAFFAQRQKPTQELFGGSLRSVLRTRLTAAATIPHAFSFAFVILLSQGAFAQAPFFKMYDTGSISSNRGVSLLTELDGFLITEWSFCDDHPCTKLLRTDAEGNPLWEKSYTTYPYGLWHGQVNCSARLNSGGYVLTGSQYHTVNDTIGDYQIWIMKVNSLGDSIWCKYFESDVVLKFH